MIHSVDGVRPSRQCSVLRPVIDRYLFCDSQAWIGGKLGHCKLFLAAEMACCVGAGRPWYGYAVKQDKVLYLIAEGASGFSHRIETWESVTRNPAFEDALVLGVGADALSTWNLLTGAAPDIPGPGRSLGEDGRPGR